VIDRIPPQAIEEERAILNALLSYPEHIDEIMALLKVEDFYRKEHANIFEAACSLYNSQKSVDILSVNNVLKSAGCLNAEIDIAEIMEVYSRPSSVRYHCSIIAEKSDLRKVIQSATEIVLAAYASDAESRDVVQDAQAKMFAISDRSSGVAYEKLDKVLPRVFQKIEAAATGNISGLPTGITNLDLITSGFHPGDLVILAGRPGMGKTAFALSIALNNAQTVPTLMFSLEMPTDQIVMRTLCSEAKVNMHSLRAGRLPHKDFVKLAQAAGPISSSRIYISDISRATPIEIMSKARRLKREAGLGLIIVDYLQLMNISKKSGNRQEEISEISRSLKSIAKDLSIPIIALAQLSRKCEEREDKRPQLSDLRESGSIEQDADIVMFLYREFVYNDKCENPNVCEVIIGKQRNGPTGTIQCYLESSCMKFENLSKDEDPMKGFTEPSKDYVK
jgi:replicative DNA helicase